MREAQVHEADASSEPDGSRDQKQPCPDDGSDGSRDALTGCAERVPGDLRNPFKSQGSGYQTRINSVLRRYVEAQKSKA